MNFEEQLRRAFDSLSGRVREEVERQVEAIRTELAGAAAAERAAAVAAAADQARSEAAGETARLKTDAERDVEEARAEARREVEQAQADARRASEQARAEIEQAVAQARADAEQKARQDVQSALAASEAAGRRMVDAVRALERSRSLSEILDTLTSSAAREADRVALLLVDGEQVRGWRFAGFDPPIINPSPFSGHPSSAGVIGRAIEQGVPVSVAAGDSPGAAPPFVAAGSAREMIAVPISLGGAVVAVLYADDAGRAGDGGSDRYQAWKPSVEIIARHAARCLETLTAFRTAQTYVSRAGATA